MPESAIFLDLAPINFQSSLIWLSHLCCSRFQEASVDSVIEVRLDFRMERYLPIITGL